MFYSRCTTLGCYTQRYSLNLLRVARTSYEAVILWQCKAALPTHLCPLSSVVERRKASREQGVCGHWFESSSGYLLIENIVLIALHSKDNAGETVRHSSYCKHT